MWDWTEMLGWEKLLLYDEADSLPVTNLQKKLLKGLDGVENNRCDLGKEGLTGMSIVITKLLYRLHSNHFLTSPFRKPLLSGKHRLATSHLSTERIGKEQTVKGLVVQKSKWKKKTQNVSLISVFNLLQARISIRQLSRKSIEKTATVCAGHFLQLTKQQPFSRSQIWKLQPGKCRLNAGSYRD